MITTGFLQNIGPWELIFILLIVLIIFGPGKLPEVGKAIGKTFKSFRDAQKGVEDDIVSAVKDEKKDDSSVKPDSNQKKPE